MQMHFLVASVPPLHFLYLTLRVHLAQESNNELHHARRPLHPLRHRPPACHLHIHHPRNTLYTSVHTTDSCAFAVETLVVELSDGNLRYVTRTQRPESGPVDSLVCSFFFFPAFFLLAERNIYLYMLPSRNAITAVRLRVHYGRHRDHGEDDV